MYSRDYWENRYASADAVWSGNPNPRLVEQVVDLVPGTALEVGSGEGADAIWLAAHGWRVMGVDISTVALERAAQHARAAGPEIAELISWQQADLLEWEPPRDAFDLVSAQFIHLPQPEMADLQRRLADSVRPGGSLLIVGHDLSDLGVVPRPNAPAMFYGPDEIAARLDQDEWDVVVADRPAREATDARGQTFTIRDAVMRAVRRPGRRGSAGV